MTPATPARNRAPDARAIAEGALLGDLAVLIVLISLYVPYAGPAMATISPVPFLLLLVRRGWRVAIESAVVASLLVAFLTGPFSALAVGTLFLRGASLGIGLRRGWRVSRTIFTGAAFLWVFVCIGVTAWSIAIPSWRSATEHGLSLTLRQGADLGGALLTLIGFGAWWHQIHPHVNDGIAWFLRYWLYLLPVVAWPVLLVAETAEYIILEVIMPRFGVQPPPFRLPWPRAAKRAAPQRPDGVRGRLLQKLEQRLSASQDRPGEGRERSRALRLAGRVAVPARSLPPEVETAPGAVAAREGDGRWGSDSRGNVSGAALPAEKTVIE